MPLPTRLQPGQGIIAKLNLATGRSSISQVKRPPSSNRSGGFAPRAGIVFTNADLRGLPQNNLIATPAIRPNPLARTPQFQPGSQIARSNHLMIAGRTRPLRSIVATV